MRGRGELGVAQAWCIAAPARDETNMNDKGNKRSSIGRPNKPYATKGENQRKIDG